MDEQQYDIQIQEAEDQIIALERRLKSMKSVVGVFVFILVAAIAVVGVTAYGTSVHARRQTLVAMEREQQARMMAEAVEANVRTNRDLAMKQEEIAKQAAEEARRAESKARERAREAVKEEAAIAQ